MLCVDTALGTFTIELHEHAAPQSCRYVLQLVDRGAFSPSSVFRIVTPQNDVQGARAPLEVIQLGHRCADPDTPILLEHESTARTGLRHLQGTVSLPRWRPGAAYESLTVCLRDEPALDYGGARQPDGQGFAAFGRVVDGWPIVEALRARAEDIEYLAQPIPVRAIRRQLTGKDALPSAPA